VQNAKVVVLSLNTDKAKDKKSDTQGIAEFAKLDYGVYRVIGRKEGFAPALFEFVLLKGSTESATLKFAAGADKKLYFEDPAEALRKFGGARIVLATAPNAKSISALTRGLSPNGKLVVVAAAMEPLVISALDLIAGKRSIQGWASGTAMDSEDTLRFSSLTGVRPMIEKFPLARVAEAYERMISGKVRFRAVLTME